MAITPAAGFVGIPAAIIIGTTAAWISNTLVDWQTKTSLDDTLDVFPCHGVGGMVGMIMTALFASQKINSSVTNQGLLIDGSPILLAKHLLGLGIVVAFALIGTFVLLKITDWILPLRVSETEKQQGLDISQHNESIVAKLG